MNRLEDYIVDTLPGSVMDWEPPVPLGPFYGPPGPLDALSDWHRALVESVATSTQTPADMAAWTSLAAVGVASRGRYVVAPKPDWHEPVHIQSLQVLVSGGGKSPVYRHITRPMSRVEAAWYAEWQDERQDWELKKKALEGAERKARRDADKASPPPDADRLLESVQRDIMQHERAEPVLKRLTTDDATAEALWSVMDRQGGAIGVMSSEGGFLANITGRYSDAPIFEPVLKGYSGDAHTIDRKTDNEHRHIPRSILALSISLQPKVVQNMGAVPGFQTMGVSSRIIMTFPQPVTWQDLDAPAPPEDVLEWWEDTIKTIATDTTGTANEPRVLTLSLDAQRAFRAEREWHREATVTNVFADLEEWGRKYPGMVLRIAGLLHIVDHPHPLTSPVSGQTISRAIAIMRPAIEHARIGHALMAGKAGGHEQAKDVLAALQRLGPPVRRTDLNQALRYRVAFDRADKLNAPLSLLEEYGYIKRVKQEAKQHPDHPGGRPVEEIFLNPKNPLTTPTTRIDTAPNRVLSVVRGFSEVPTETESEPEYLDPTGTDHEWSMDL